MRSGYTKWESRIENIEYSFEYADGDLQDLINSLEGIVNNLLGFVCDNKLEHKCVDYLTKVNEDTFMGDDFGIEVVPEKKTHEVTIGILKSDYERYNALLDISDLTDELLRSGNNYWGARVDDYIPGFCATFDNGKYITIDLASGSSNYYDNIVLWGEDDRELFTLDCTFEIEDFEFEFENEIYKVKFEIHEEN